MVFYPNNSFMISRMDFEQMVNTQRIDIVYLQVIIAFIMLECLWAQIIMNVFEYRWPFMDFMVDKLNFDEEKVFEPKNRKYLCKMYIITDTIARFIYIFVSIELLLVCLIALMFFIWMMHAIQMLGQLFIALNFFVFLIEYIKVRIEQLYKKFIQKNIFKQNEWKRFHYEYVFLYTETAHTNRAARIVLFYLEAISKPSIISNCIFYTKQSSWSIFTTSVIISLMSTFCLINILYSRISHLPSCNQKCARSILRRIARTQRRLNNIKLKHSKNQHNNRYWIKLTLFVQTMINNHFGFTCGQVFFITKFRYIQIFIMNFILILKFYKKINR
uniref:Uncharacterized protein LOC113790601 n=1 Tax=Dermatophagoides pteronyssinus TaxID=6956 RepID=A0A6P6XTD1_DERPT|nr:uncharacterized protein LOC113790601 [Dermatophagoides pteronyssinus]